MLAVLKSTFEQKAKKKRKSKFHGKTALPFIRGVTLKCSSRIRSYYFVTISHKEYEMNYYYYYYYVEILYNRQMFFCSFHSQRLC